MDSQLHVGVLDMGRPYNAVKQTDSADESVIAELWDPVSTRKMARQFAEIAADALLERGGAVRQPGSQALATRILRWAARSKSLPGLVRRIQRSSLRLAH